jgi:hypothetical protein
LLEGRGVHERNRQSKWNSGRAKCHDKGWTAH